MRHPRQSRQAQQGNLPGPGRAPPQQSPHRRHGAAGVRQLPNGSEGTELTGGPPRRGLKFPPSDPKQPRSRSPHGPRNRAHPPAPSRRRPAGRGAWCSPRPWPGCAWSEGGSGAAASGRRRHRRHGLGARRRDLSPARGARRDGAGRGRCGAGACAWSGRARGAPGRRCCADVSGRALRAVSRCCGRFPPSAAAAPFPRPPPPPPRAWPRAPRDAPERAGTQVPGIATTDSYPLPLAVCPSRRAATACPQSGPARGGRRSRVHRVPVRVSGGSAAGPGPRRAETTARPGRERRRRSAGCLGEPPRQRLPGCAPGPLHSFLLLLPGKPLALLPATLGLWLSPPGPWLARAESSGGSWGPPARPCQVTVGPAPSERARFPSLETSSKTLFPVSYWLSSGTFFFSPYLKSVEAKGF